MFTGIITAIGRVRAARAASTAWGAGKTIEVALDDAAWLADVALGDSIAVNGACMTVTALDAAGFGFDCSAESLRLTVGLDEPGAEVNLEKALRADARLGGHWVSGHVDGIAEVLALDPVGESRRFELLLPAALAPYLALKGSLAVHGVSLTVNAVLDTEAGCRVAINLVPHTVEHTNLRTLRAGSRVNVEIDLIARYLRRMLDWEQRTAAATQPESV